MIKSSKHKGLAKFFTTGSTAGIQAQHTARLEEQLQALHTACEIEDMEIPEWSLHRLKGKQQNLWAISVNKNWRIVFEYYNSHAYIVNYEDYH
jgi:proteic killer suppression protein